VLLTPKHAHGTLDLVSTCTARNDVNTTSNSVDNASTTGEGRNTMSNAPSNNSMGGVAMATMGHKCWRAASVRH